MKNFKIVAILMALSICFTGCQLFRPTQYEHGCRSNSCNGAHKEKVAEQKKVVEQKKADNGMNNVKTQAQSQLNGAKVETVTDANGNPAVKITFNSGLLFATGKAVLSAKSQVELKKLANIMKQNKGMSVVVKGYTDNTGTDAINNPLSQNRAKSVANCLVKNGVPVGQLKNVKGFGSSNPVASNETVAGRQQNRRVEIFLFASKEMVQKAQSSVK